MDHNTLRKAQLVQLEIAKEVKRVCEENDIMYFLDSGTLLGAVRHKGFIPWDDDMDLGMVRSEYEKFLSIAPKKLNEKYELVEWMTEEEYPHPFCKVMKKGTVYKEKVQGGDSVCGIFVDIFPYDNYPEENRCEEKVKLTIYRTMVRAKCHYTTWCVKGFDLKKWIKNVPFRLLAMFCKKETLIKKYEATIKKYEQVDGKFLFTHGCDMYGAWTIPKNCFADYKKLQFEDDEFNCPGDYDLYLRSGYGDYMQLPPEEERENRHSIEEVDFGE